MSKTVLMCAPEHFDIEYEINPWMHTNNQVNSSEAKAQWNYLKQIYTKKLGWTVEQIEPVAGLPDMVFTANGALVHEDKVALPRFRQPDRQPETSRFEAWFRSAGYKDLFTPKYDFEGEGDALFWNDTLFAGYPWRTDKPAHKELAEFFDVEVVSLQLADARFYHLDTALTIVSSDTVALYPTAFTKESLEQVRDRVPNVIEASDEDAVAYGLNAMSDGKRIVVPDKAIGLIERYRMLGMEVHPCAITEFQKSGGGVKCLTLDLRS